MLGPSAAAKNTAYLLLHSIFRYVVIKTRGNASRERIISAEDGTRSDAHLDNTRCNCMQPSCAVAAALCNYVAYQQLIPHMHLSCAVVVCKANDCPAFAT